MTRPLHELPHGVRRAMALAAAGVPADPLAPLVETAGICWPGDDDAPAAPLSVDGGVAHLQPPLFPTAA